MIVVWRKARLLVTMVLLCATGSLPACGTMGGGGMKYFVEPATEATFTAS